MTKSYADQCLERAEKATEGPWSINARNCKYYDENDKHKSLGDCETLCDASDGNDEYFLGARVIGPKEPDRSDFTVVDAIFIARARTDVPELARRLKRACEALRNLHFDSTKGIRAGETCPLELADELERLPEDK